MRPSRELVNFLGQLLRAGGSVALDTGDQREGSKIAVVESRNPTFEKRSAIKNLLED